MMRSILRPALLIVLLAASSASAAPDGHEERGQERFSFALIGDTPYGSGANSSGDEGKFVRVIDDINQDHNVDFVVHTGDIKTGSSLDTDELIKARFTLYQGFHKPFIYTPGDNEWTDSHRPKEGWYNPLERLAFVRKIFFPHPGWSTGGHPMRVQTQAHDAGFGTFVENQMWVRSRVVFACIHVVGSNDDLDKWTIPGSSTLYADWQPGQKEEYDARRAANLAWIDKAFELADEIHARGVFIFQQADPGFEFAKTDPARLIFNEILDRVFAKTIAFGKPVLFTHGDSHYYRVDKPALDDAGHLIENLNRVENFGDTNVHWVRVTVDPDSRNVFHVEPMIIPENSFPH